MRQTTPVYSIFFYFMIARTRYTFGMEFLVSTTPLLSLTFDILTPFWQGFSGISLLFALCFVGVHAAKFAVSGWQFYDGKKAPSKPPSPPKTESKPPEPIYYIVEKKRRRSKPIYGDPKEIRFK